MLCAAAAPRPIAAKVKISSKNIKHIEHFWLLCMHYSHRTQTDRANNTNLQIDANVQWTLEYNHKQFEYINSLLNTIICVIVIADSRADIYITDAGYASVVQDSLWRRYLRTN